MIKIGKLSLLETHTLLVPKDERVYYTLNIDDSDEPLNIELFFSEDDIKDEHSGGGKSGLSIEAEEDKAVINFINWNNPFGSSLKKPVSFASSDVGDEVYLLATASLSGSIYVLNVQFLKKEANDE